MRVGIPTEGYGGADEVVGEHFGRVPTYTIVNIETGDVKVIPNTSEHTGGIGYPPEILARENVHIMLCRGLGRRAIDMFESFGIEVYIGATGTVRDAVDAFERGMLKKATQSDGCSQHAFGDSGHYR